MSNILEEFEGPLHTRAAQLLPGERVVFGGYDLRTTFAGSDWIDLYLLGICRRRLPRAHLNVIGRLWSYTSYPDARLWCNRGGALTGSTRGTGSQAIAAGIAANEAIIYGQGPLTDMAAFLSEALAATHSGVTLDQVVRAELARHTSARYHC